MDGSLCGLSPRLRLCAASQRAARLAASLFLTPRSGNGGTHPGGLGAIQDVTKGGPLQQNLREA